MPRTVAEQDGPGPSAIKVSDYLVGPQVDEALAAGQDLIISWPFVEAQISDWTQAEAIWQVSFPPAPACVLTRSLNRKYALFTTLGLRRTQMESPVQLSIFPGLPRSSCERTCQMFFERFNVAGFSILERPMAQIYASNALNGLVIDLGYHWTDISAIYDGFLLKRARAGTPVGVKACLAFLAQVLKTNSTIVTTLSPPENPLSPEALHQAFQDLASTLYHRGLIKPPVLGPAQLASGEVEDEGVTDIASILVAGKERAVIEANIKKRANQKASAAEQAKLREIEAMDLITLEFNGKEVTVGKERHRFCDPLFDPRVLKHVPGLEATLYGHSEKEKGQNPVLSVSEAASHVLGRAAVDQRQYILGSPNAAGGLLATGDMTSYIKGGLRLNSTILLLIRFIFWHRHGSFLRRATWAIYHSEPRTTPHE